MVSAGQCVCICALQCLNAPEYVNIFTYSNTLPRFRSLFYYCGDVAFLFLFAPLPPRKPPWGFLPPTGKGRRSRCHGESVNLWSMDGVYLRKPRARTYPGLVSPGLLNPCLLILAWSLCNQLSLDALILDSLNSAQSLIPDVLILLLCNGPQEKSRKRPYSW